MLVRILNHAYTVAMIPRSTATFRLHFQTAPPVKERVCRATGLALLLPILLMVLLPLSALSDEPPRWLGKDAGQGTTPWPYVPEPVDSWVYQEIERQVVLGVLQDLPWTSRLLPRALIAQRVAEAWQAGFHTPGLRRLAREFAWESRFMGLGLPQHETFPMLSLGPETSHVKFNGLLELNGTVETATTPDWNPSKAGVMATYWSPKSLSVYGEFSVSGVKNATRLGNRVVGDFTFLAPRFGVTWHSSVMELWLSRENVRWAPGRSGGLLAGGGSITYPQLGFRIHIGSLLTASAHHGWLSQPEERYVAYHRVEANLGRFRAGLAEAVRYDRTAPDPMYMVNLVPYAIVERLNALDTEGNVHAKRDSLYRSNYMLSMDLHYRVTDQIGIYGELLLDDLKTAEGLPQRLGYQVGASWVTQTEGRQLSLQAEFSRVLNYVYSTYYQRDFQHGGDPLGYPRGPDVRAVDFWGDIQWELDWAAEVRGFWVTKGEGAVGKTWCPEGITGDHCVAVGPASASDFMGIVETRTGFEAGPSWTPRDNLRVQVLGGLVHVDNLNHTQDAVETHATGRVAARWRW